MQLVLLALCFFYPVFGEVTFKDGAYSGVRIVVDHKLPIENCREILQNLEVGIASLFHFDSHLVK